MTEDQKNLEEETSTNSLDLQELAEQYKQEMEEKRPFYQELIITLGFVFGPIFLIFASLFDNFLWGIGNTLYYGFVVITILFFGSIVSKAYQDSRKFG